MGVNRRSALSRLLTLFVSARYSQGFMKTLTQTNFFLYVGTYGKGIFGYRFSAETGDLKPLGLLTEITNPSFITVDPSHQHLYAVSELEGKVNGGVAAFAIDRATGSLTPLNTRSSDGQAPCYVSVDGTGKMVFVANYGTGQLAVFPIEQNGSLGELRQLVAAHGSSVNPERQSGPHAHEAVPSHDNRFVYVPDLGLDQIRIYKIDPAAAKVTPSDPPFAKLPPGNGPRHIALSANGKFAYVANELKPVVTVFARDPASGALTEIQQVSTVPKGFTGDSAPAEILLDHADKFVYASNRGLGTITVFAVTPEKGTLTQIQIAETGGTWPRGVEIAPGGRFLLAGDQKTNKFVLFQISPDSGQLNLTGKIVDVPSPVSFVFVPVKE